MTARVSRILAELRERFEALYGHRRGRGPLVLDLCRERVPV